MSTTLEKIDLTKEDFVFKNVIVSDVSLYDRTSQGKANLIFVKFVGGLRFGASPSMLYFGKDSFENLSNLRGQRVNVLLQPGNDNFAVADIQKI